MSEYLRLFSSIVERVDAGQACALCTVVNSRGSTPQTAGAIMLLDPAGRTDGTLGGGCVEAEVRRRALELLNRGESGLLSFTLNHDYGWDDGLICGGKMDVAVMTLSAADAVAGFRAAAERLARQTACEVPLRVGDGGRMVEYDLRVEPTPTLLIAGAGHVGAALARLASTLDFRVVVIDDRADLLDRARLPEPIEGLAGDIANTLRGWPIDANTHVVIVTRGHQHDEQALHAVIDSPAKYMGMIGSRRKIKLIFDDLIGLGVDPAKLARVHAPIGLDISSVTVPEIALSIAGQLVQTRRAVSSKIVEGPFELQAAAT